MGTIRATGKALQTSLLLVGGVALVVIILGLAPWKLPFSNPFRTEEKERTQTPILLDLQDVSRYEAATGSFQVIVDTEQDTRFVPGIIKGEHVIFIAEGSVNAVVDFSNLTKGAIKVSADGKSVTVMVPQPTLSKPRIDPDNTRVQSRDRGVLDRLQDAVADEPTDEQPLYKAANAKIATAARRSQLLGRARTNTRIMLEALVKDLGFDKVVVRFQAPGRP